MNPETFTTRFADVDLNEKCSVLIGPTRDLVELQRIVVTYNDNMPDSDHVEIDLYQDAETRIVKGMLTGTGMSIFHIGIRYGEVMERKYIKDLEPAVRNILLQK